MHLQEVVEDKVQGQCMTMVVDFLGERICQTSEPAQNSEDCQVTPTRVTRPTTGLSLSASM